MKQLLQRETAVYLLRHADLSYNSINEIGRGYIKRRVPSSCSQSGSTDSMSLVRIDFLLAVLKCSDNRALDAQNFLLRALLNLNLRATSRVQIDSSSRCRDNESQAMLPRQACKTIRAYFVSGVAIRSDPVGADNDRHNIVLVGFEPEQRAGHRVGDERRRDSVMQQFVACQSRALIVRASLGVKGLVQDLSMVQGAYNAQSSTIACCRERSIDASALPKDL